jgi:5-methylcytosine-specific restriction endonuclease McrA
MNCAPENLLALCQKCHNRLDAKHRAKTRRERRASALESIAPSLPLVTSIISQL